LNEEISRQEMIADIQQKSRHYAKKQLTWTRKNTDIQWIFENRLTKQMLDRISRHLETDFPI